jgi:divinyl chlorophyllide a 8-vinyl-reductase
MRQCVCLLLVLTGSICVFDSSAFVLPNKQTEKVASLRLKASSVDLFFAQEVVEEPNKGEKDPNAKKTVVIAGATGYIGKAVVAESVKRGYNTVALVRSLDKVFSEEGQRLYGETFKGAKVVQVDVSDAYELTKCMSSIDIPVDTIVSCLASPVGTKKEAYAIDYQATLNCLNAGRDPDVNARHFILLSAFCCRRPLLQLQQAKLKFEAELAAQNDVTWSVVRPTAFFKSVSGQLEGIQNGNPYVLFGDGAVTRCNPIAESELAEYMLNCMTDETKCNRIMNIGGPDKPLTNKMLGDVS